MLNGMPQMPFRRRRPFIASVGAMADGAGDSVSMPVPPALRIGDALAGIFGTENGNAVFDGVNNTSVGTQGFQLRQTGGNGTFAASARAALSTKQSSGAETAVGFGLFGSHAIGRMIAVRDGKAVPNVTGGAGGSGTAVSFPSVTTTVDNCLIALIVGTSNTATVGGWTGANVGTSISELLEMFDDATTQDDDGGIALAFAYQKMAGATGTFGATLSSSSSWGAVIAAFELVT